MTEQHTLTVRKSESMKSNITSLLIFFFFQAEDGIRDDLVTGVQTCALPISARAAILPACVSTVTSRPLQVMRLTGVDSETGTCSPSFAISVPRPWRQATKIGRASCRERV